jgi:hypothetical protein
MIDVESRRVARRWLAVLLAIVGAVAAFLARCRTASVRGFTSLEVHAPPQGQTVLGQSTPQLEGYSQKPLKQPSVGPSEGSRLHPGFV